MNIHTNRLDGGPFIHLARWLQHVNGGEIYTQVKNESKWILNYSSYIAYYHSGILQGLDYVVYNTEILKHKFATTPDYKLFLEGAREVWDYSQRNSEYFPVIYKPFGTYPANMVKEQPKEWDVCFYGLMSPRRDEILKLLRGRGLKVVHVGLDNYNKVKNAKFGAALKEGALDDYIAKSKVVLSIHYLDGYHLNDSFRIIPALMKGAVVVAEPAGDGWEYEHENLHVTGLIVGKCIELCAGR